MLPETEIIQNMRMPFRQSLFETQTNFLIIPVWHNYVIELDLELRKVSWLAREGDGVCLGQLDGCRRVTLYQ